MAVAPDSEARMRLLAWYDAHQRTLPWREDTDPYRVLVSEVMLQQTRVETVVPRYLAWLDQFPTVHAVAEAPEAEILAAWSGLGYYARARNLWRACRHVAAHGWPESAAALEALPGIGPYSAAAVGSIAFGDAVAAIDGNVQRVMSRLEGIHERIDTAAGGKTIRTAARNWLDHARPGDWNQAVMELGATICTPGLPDCAACPLQPSCWAAAHGGTGLPNTKPKARPRPSAPCFARIFDGPRVLMVQEPGRGLLGGLWRLPGGTEDASRLTAQVAEQTGVQPTLEPTVRRVKHIFTHRVWNMHIQDGAAHQAEREGSLPVRWIDPTNLQDVGISTAMRKALEA